MRRDHSEAGAAAVVVPMHPEEVCRVRAIRVDIAKSGDLRWPHPRPISEFGEGWEPHPALPQPLRRPVARGNVENFRYNRSLRHRLAVIRPHNALAKPIISSP